MPCSIQAYVPQIPYNQFLQRFRAQAQPYYQKEREETYDYSLDINQDALYCRDQNYTIVYIHDNLHELVKPVCFFHKALLGDRMLDKRTKEGMVEDLDRNHK